MDNMAVISRFIEDIDCLAPITQAVNKVNLFEILSVSRTEIRHSNLLAWLMNPHGNHGLGDCVLRGMVQFAEEGLQLDYSSFSIRREDNHIDILAVSQKEKTVVCIENKTYSGEHDDQLEKYRRYVDTTLSGYRRILIFLTRKGKTASDPENWLAMSYGDVLKIIEGARTGKALQPEVNLILDNYAEVIRGFGGGDDPARKLCEEVYQKHRKALDLIFSCNLEDSEENGELTEEQKTCRELYWKYRKELMKINEYRPKQKDDPVTEAVRLWAEAKTQEGYITTCPEKRTKTFERFTTRFMSELLPDAVGCRSGWNTENFYFYEISNSEKNREHKLTLQLCVNLRNIPDDLREAAGRICRVVPPVHESAEHIILFETDRYLFREDADEQKVMDQLDAFLEQAGAFERRVAEGLGL